MKAKADVSYYQQALEIFASNEHFEPNYKKVCLELAKTNPKAFVDVVNKLTKEKEEKYGEAYGRNYQIGGTVTGRFSGTSSSNFTSNFVRFYRSMPGDLFRSKVRRLVANGKRDYAERLAQARYGFGPNGARIKVDAIVRNI